MVVVVVVVVIIMVLVTILITKMMLMMIIVCNLLSCIWTTSVWSICILCSNINIIIAIIVIICVVSMSVTQNSVIFKASFIVITSSASVVCSILIFCFS